MSYTPEQEILLNAVKSETLNTFKRLFKPDCLTESNGDEFGYTLLMAAIKRSHKGIVSFLVDKNCRLTRPNDKIAVDDTPLQWALRTRYYDMIPKLLDHGASVYEKCQGKMSVIRQAWRHVKKQVIDKMLASVDFHHSSPDNPDDLLHFCIACERVSEIAIEKFLQVGFSADIFLDMYDENERGYRPLHYAVAKTHIPTVALLLGKNADVNLKSETGVTPLHLACQLEKIDLIELLLQNKADPNIKNKKGHTSFHIAFYKKRYDIISLLQPKISKTINHIDPRGLSHFHILCTINSCTAVSSFLQSGTATVDMLVNDDGEAFSGYSALHFAAEFNREDIVRLLLKHHANVNYYPSSTKVTALHLACLHSDVKYHELLNCPNELKTIRKRIKENDWALSKQSQINVIELLLDHECDVNARDYSEKSAIMYACEIHTAQLKFLGATYLWKTTYNFAIRQLWEIQKEIIKYLMSKKALIDIHTLEKKSMLHLIIESDCPSLVLFKFLVKNGLKVHSLDNTSPSMLHLAVNMLHESIVEFLLCQNVDVNIKDSKSSTCLHDIITTTNNSLISSKLSIMKRLLRNNADTESLNGNKQTPLDVAFSPEKYLEFRLLLEYGADVNNMNFMKYISEIKDLDEDSIWYNYFEMMIKTLIIHVQKLKILSFHVNRFVEVYVREIGKLIFEDLPETNMIESKCRKELEKMKSIKINPHTTLFTVLYEQRNSMVRHTRNETLNTILESKFFDKDFPQLGFSLRLQFRRSLARKDLLVHSSRSLNSLIGFHLPETVFDQISGYLLDAELDCLNKAGSSKVQKKERKHKKKPLAKRQRL